MYKMQFRIAVLEKKLIDKIKIQDVILMFNDADIQTIQKVFVNNIKDLHILSTKNFYLIYIPPNASL